MQRQHSDHSFMTAPIWRSLSAGMYDPGLRQRSASAPAALSNATVTGQSDDTPSFVEMTGAENDTSTGVCADTGNDANDSGDDAAAAVDPNTFSRSSCDVQCAQSARARLRGLPSMRIVFMIVGSRGDVQPFIVWAKELKAAGHSPRIATHAMFEDWVRGHGIDFFPTAGDPHKLMEVMVESNILSPRQLSGVGWKRAFIRQLLVDNWHACTQPVPVAAPAATDGDGDGEGGDGEGGDGERDPKPPQACASYRADLLIANPPSFAAPHIAERLGVPLHMAVSSAPAAAPPACRHPHACSSHAHTRARLPFCSLFPRCSLRCRGHARKLYSTH